MNKTATIKLTNLVKTSLFAVLSSTIFIGSATATEMYINEPEWGSTSNGYKVRGSCSITIDSSIDFCNKPVIDDIDRLVKNNKPNFGKDKKSFLTRFWDKNLNHWVYLAIDTKTKRIHPLPKGVSAMANYSPEVKDKYKNMTQEELIEFSKNPKVRFGKGDRICTSGVGTSLINDSSAEIDMFKGADICYLYDEDEGFVYLNEYTPDDKLIEGVYDGD